MRLALPLAIIALVLIGNSALGFGGPENVLVVKNGNSLVSQHICDYYVAKRNIAPGNVFTVYTVDSSASPANEAISPANYTSLIEQPIRSFLAANNLTNQIQYIVLTKGIPIRLTVDITGGNYGQQSVDSMLAAMDLTAPIKLDFTDEHNVVVASAYANEYWRSALPFSHANRGGYLVTRLDGYTEADAKALVDRAFAISNGTRFLLDIDPNFGLGNSGIQPKSILLPDGSINQNYQLYYSDYNADMTHSSQILATRQGISVKLETTTAFVDNPLPLLGYISWGSNDHHFVPAAYQMLPFAPRSIAETAVSTSGRTFFHTTTGQSMIADLIAQGVAGAKGYVSEPFLDAIASPSVLLDFYTSGRNLAESFYAASRLLRWKDIVLGDPLCCLDGLTVGAAKSLANGTQVTISGGIVTAGTDDLSDRIYLEDPDRASGIQIYLGQAIFDVPRGSSIKVTGILDTHDGERRIINPTITP